MRKTTHRWTRLATRKWQDAWEERLLFLDPQRVAMMTWPDSRTLKIEAYCDEATAKRLVKEFGGRATRLQKTIWSGDPDQPRAPIPIRGKLKIFPDEKTFKQSANKPVGIYIPASMAFGTGEHATTATCLRLLCDLNLPDSFTAADLGSGSGVLAIAAEKLGAQHVHAIDFDRNAVREGRRNLKRNQCRNILIEQLSVADWSPLPRSLDLVMANLYSELLIASAKTISKSLKPGAPFIYSGTLIRQAEEVSEALRACRIQTLKTVKRGKWIAALATKVGR